MPITITRTKHPHMYAPVFPLYGPGLVLREDANWRNWRKYNGVGVRIGWTIFWLELRGPKERMLDRPVLARLRRQR